VREGDRERESGRKREIDRQRERELGWRARGRKRNP
jgi:hypothetical protein